MQWKIVTVGLIAGVMLATPGIGGTGGGRAKGSDSYPKDVYGNTYSRSGNLFRDRDGNGVINLFQQRDRAKKSPGRTKDGMKRKRRSPATERGINHGNTQTGKF